MGTKNLEVHKKKLGAFMVTTFRKIFCSTVSLFVFKRTFDPLKEPLIYLLFLLSNIFEKLLRGIPYEMCLKVRNTDTFEKVKKIYVRDGQTG